MCIRDREHLVTQLKWRLQEGEGEAIYQIGVEDSGLLAGLSDAEMSASLQTLQTMADRYCVFNLCHTPFLLAVGHSGGIIHHMNEVTLR